MLDRMPFLTGLRMMTAAVCLSSCTSDRNPGFREKDLRIIDPRRYLETLSPYERERALIRYDHPSRRL